MVVVQVKEKGTDRDTNIPKSKKESRKDRTKNRRRDRNSTEESRIEKENSQSVHFHSCKLDSHHRGLAFPVKLTITFSSLQIFIHSKLSNTMTEVFC